MPPCFIMNYLSAYYKCALAHKQTPVNTMVVKPSGLSPTLGIFKTFLSHVFKMANFFYGALYTFMILLFTHICERSKNVLDTKTRRFGLHWRNKPIWSAWHYCSGYDVVSLGHQQPNTLKECTAFTFRGLQFHLWTWRWGRYASQWCSIVRQKNRILNYSATKSSKLQLSTFTVNCLPLSGFLILCCSHLDLDKGLGNCMELPTQDNTESR